MVQSLDLTTKKKTPFASQFDGKKFSSPNDVVRMKITAWCSSPIRRTASRNSMTRPRKKQPFNGVYRVAKDGSVSVVEKELHRPNGVALSPDERTLYVAQSEPTKAIIMAYSLDADGNVTGKKLFHDFTDLIGDKAPRPARWPRGSQRRHDLRHRPWRRVRAVEGRQTPGTHQRRQGHGQLQVRR